MTYREQRAGHEIGRMIAVMPPEKRVKEKESVATDS